MKIQTLLEMPQIIDQQEIKLPWGKVNYKTAIWTAPLIGSPDVTLAAHKMTANDVKNAAMIVAYKGAVGDPASAIAGMFLSSLGEQPTVWGVLVGKKFRGQQLALNMYITLAEMGYDLCSDDTQTAAGSAIWKALAQRFPNNVRVLADDDTSFQLVDWPKDPFTDPDIQLVFSLNKRADIKKSA